MQELFLAIVWQVIVILVSAAAAGLRHCTSMLQLLLQTLAICLFEVLVSQCEVTGMACECVGLAKLWPSTCMYWDT